MRRLVLATALIHVPFVLALTHWLALAGASWGLLLAGGLAGLLTAVVHKRLEPEQWDRPISPWRRYLLEEPFYVHLGAGIFAVPLLVLGGLASALTSGAPPLAEIAGHSYLLGAAISLWGVLIRRRWVIVRTIEVPVKGLPAAFDGYRIAHLSDLHIGSLCPAAWARRWVAQVNRLDVDLVALTGDLVTSGVRFHQAIATTVGELRARDGVLAVMGNHDYFGEGQPLLSLLREQGITVLRNERRQLRRGGSGLLFAGVDDTYKGRADVGATLAGHDPAEPLIALAHNPMLFDELADGGASLVLSGHTHWGQLAVPLLAHRLNLYRLWQRSYLGGRHRRGDATLYVTAGLGTTGPPFRLGAAPEIAVVTLRRATAA